MPACLPAHMCRRQGLQFWRLPCRSWATPFAAVGSPPYCLPAFACIICPQIDSHMRFVDGWDTKLLRMLSQVRCVLLCMLCMGAACCEVRSPFAIMPSSLHAS